MMIFKLLQQLQYLILISATSFLFIVNCFFLLYRLFLKCLILVWGECLSVSGLVATIWEWIKLRIHIIKNGIKMSLNVIVYKTSQICTKLKKCYLLTSEVSLEDENNRNKNKFITNKAYTIKPIINIYFEVCFIHQFP